MIIYARGVAACGWRHEGTQHYVHGMHNFLNALDDDGARVQTFGDYSVLKETSIQVRDDAEVSNFVFCQPLLLWKSFYFANKKVGGVSPPSEDAYLPPLETWHATSS